MDGISTDDLEIARLMGRDTRLATLSVDNHVKIATLIGMPQFRKLTGHLGLWDKDLECIFHDVQFLEDNMDK